MVVCWGSASHSERQTAWIKLKIENIFFKEILQVTEKHSAARKFELKVAKFLKTLKDLHQRPPENQKYPHQSSENNAKNLFKQFFMTTLVK